MYVVVAVPLLLPVLRVERSTLRRVVPAFGVTV